MRGSNSLFSRFVLRGHNCSKLVQSWSWIQEEKGGPFPQAVATFKVQTFPKRIRPLIKPLLKNSFATNFQGTGPWEGPIHFSRFVLKVHNCSKLFQSWSWSQEKKEKPFTKAIAKFKAQTFPKKIRSQISKALGHERVQFTLVGLFAGFANAANFSKADPGAKRRKKSLLQKQLPSSKPKPFPKESDRLLNPH